MPPQTSRYVGKEITTDDQAVSHDGRWAGARLRRWPTIRHGVRNLNTDGVDGLLGEEHEPAALASAIVPDPDAW